MNHAQTIIAEDAPPLRIVTPEFFLATKLDAFQGRGECDWYGSRDLEDIVSVLDGCSDIVARVLAAPESLRSALACSFGELLDSRSFLDALPAHLPQDPASRQRASIVLQRMRHIAGRIEAEPGNG